jgi:hypothetical protein
MCAASGYRTRIGPRPSRSPLAPTLTNTLALALALAFTTTLTLALALTLTPHPSPLTPHPHASYRAEGPRAGDALWAR